MKVQHIGRTWMIVASMVLAGASSATAQHEGHQTPDAAGSAISAQAMSCSHNSQMATAALDAASQRIEDARQSNNPSKMRAAVADLQTTMARMKTLLADCVSLNASAASSMPAMDHSKMATTPNAGATASASRVDITFNSRPTPLKIGENAFDVTVNGADGKPVPDADVSILFVMPAMPAMKMPEMRNEVKLKSAGGGKYTGTGQVMMAGQWNVTISVKKDGSEVGQKRLTATAR